MWVSYGHDRGLIQRLANGQSGAAAAQGACAYRVDENGHACLMRQEHLLQILLCLAVVQNSASAEYEGVELLDFRACFGSRQLPHGHCALDRMTLQRIPRITRENYDFHRQRAAELGDERLENCLVAEIQATIGA
jgi:hypothetical protein